MTRGQRLTFLGIAAVFAVVAVILLASGGDETDRGAGATGRPRKRRAPQPPRRAPDIKKELAPNKTVTVAFKATITGIFEIELEHSATQLASLKVLP
jgi:hypothetical protein